MLEQSNEVMYNAARVEGSFAAPCAKPQMPKAPAPNHLHPAVTRSCSCIAMPHTMQQRHWAHRTVWSCVTAGCSLQSSEVEIGGEESMPAATHKAVHMAVPAFHEKQAVQQCFCQHRTALHGLAALAAASLARLSGKLPRCPLMRQGCMLNRERLVGKSPQKHGTTPTACKARPSRCWCCSQPAAVCHNVGRALKVSLVRADGLSVAVDASLAALALQAVAEAAEEAGLRVSLGGAVLGGEDE